MNNVWIQDLTPWVVVGAALGAGCAAVTRDTLPNTSAIKAGMGGDDVVARLGKPAWSFEKSPVQEWRYCSTDRPSDLIVAIFLRNDVVVEKTSYRVELSDLDFSDTTGGRIGSCRDKIAAEGPARARSIRARVYGG